MKRQSFCPAKETLSRTKRQPTEWLKLFANESPDKEFTSKIDKHLLQLHTQTKNKPQRSPTKNVQKIHYWTVLQRRGTDGQITYEKLISITDYQRNAYQNLYEVPPYTSWNGHHSQFYRQYMLERVWSKGEPITLWVRIWTGAATVENSREIPQKTQTNRHLIQKSHSWPSLQRKPWREQTHVLHCSLQNSVTAKRWKHQSVHRQRSG